MAIKNIPKCYLPQLEFQITVLDNLHLLNALNQSTTQNSLLRLVCDRKFKFGFLIFI